MKNNYWVYKCRSNPREYAKNYGDWAVLFSAKVADTWGSRKHIRELGDAKKGDIILAYQSDRNEVLGLAHVTGWKNDELVLKPLRSLGFKVRPLRQRSKRIEAIKAFQPGPIRTLYAITRAEVAHLLKAAGERMDETDDEGPDPVTQEMRGGGFGSPEQNKKVEQAAMRKVTAWYKKDGWRVQDVSAEKGRGYDLVCKRRATEVHVEVKGTNGEQQRFIITAQEKRVWTEDKRYVLALVENALRKRSPVRFFPGSEAARDFDYQPIAFYAERRGGSMKIV